MNIYNNFKYLNIKCYSCKEEGHVARYCPLIHYPIDVLKLLNKRNLTMKRFRKCYKRGQKASFHSLADIDEVRSCFHDFYECIAYYITAGIIKRENSIESSLYPFCPTQNKNFKKFKKKRSNSTRILLEINSQHKKIYNTLSYNIDRVSEFKNYFPKGNVSHILSSEFKRIKPIIDSDSKTTKKFVRISGENNSSKQNKLKTFEIYEDKTYYNLFLLQKNSAKKESIDRRKKKSTLILERISQTKKIKQTIKTQNNENEEFIY